MTTLDDQLLLRKQRTFWLTHAAAGLAAFTCTIIAWNVGTDDDLKVFLGIMGILSGYIFLKSSIEAIITTTRIHQQKRN